MTESAEVFIAAEGTIDALTDTVGEVLGLDFELDEGEAVALDVTLLEHGLPGFDQFRYCLYVDPMAGVDLREQALEYFAALKATNRWPLLLTHNLEEVVARFEPER